MGPVLPWKVCHIIVTWCDGGSVTTLSLGETGTRATATVGVVVGVGLAVARGVGAAVGAGAAVAVAAARVGALVAAGVDGAIVAVGAIVGAGVDGALVAAAGACVGASVASSPQAMISRDKTISAPTKEYTRQYLDHCILFMLRCLLSFTGESGSKTVAGGLIMVSSILGVSKIDVNL